MVCPTLFDPMDYSPPVSSVGGILQARMLEYVAISSPRGSCISCTGRQILYHWATSIVFKFLLCFYISAIDKHSKNCLFIEVHVKPPLLFFSRFFFSSFIFISRRLITLQYCSGFCHTLIWISQKPPLLCPVIDETWLLPWGTHHMSMCTACKMTVEVPTVLKLSSQGISAFRSHRTVPEDVQTTVQLCSFHTLSR